MWGKKSLEHFGIKPDCESTTMMAYFCHHLLDNYVDMSDLYDDLSVIYVINHTLGCYTAFSCR